MKLKLFQRGMQVPNGQLDPAPHSLGRVARMRELDSAGEPLPSLRSEARLREAAAIHAERHRVIVTWSLFLLATVVVVIGVFMKFWLDTRGKQIAAEEAARAPDNVRVVSQFVSPGESEALALVQRALAIRDPGKIAAVFRLGEATPEQVVAFLVSSAAHDGPIRKYDWLRSMDTGRLLKEGVLVSYAEDHAKSARLAFLTPDAAGVWKVDFAAFARSSSPTWKDLFDGREDHALVRVFVGPDTYFNGPFQDERQWMCIGIASPEAKELLPEGQELLRGYCKAGSAQAKAMARIFAGGESQTCRATLELRRVPGADARQFEITRVLAEDWVLPDQPYDEKFQ